MRPPDGFRQHPIHLTIWVSETADIWHINRGYCTPTCMKIGYLSVAANGTRYYVHRLVAETFLPFSKELRLTVNHKDGNKLNNHISNLEFLTLKENIQHAWKSGLYRPRSGVENYHAILTKAQVLEIRRLLDSGLSQRKIAKMFNISRGPVDRIHRKLGGYMKEFENL